MKLKVAIITMHKVLNFGSALQAYALQETIKKLGYSAEIIDYKFPNEFQVLNSPKKSLWRRITDGKLLYKIKYHLALHSWLSWDSQKTKFDTFYKKFFSLTRSYNNVDELLKYPPDCDYLCIGSDQVWNYTHTAGDSVFLGEFINNKDIKRFSFASSFSKKTIDENLYHKFKIELPKFKAISVRENSGVRIIKHLTGLNAQQVCDPVFLLNKHEYLDLAMLSHIKINEKYILAYVLEYNFNPHPIIDKIINRLQGSTGYKVVYLLCGGIPLKKVKNSIVISDADPLDFLSLIANSEAVITSSFHGAALSLILEKNVFGITDSKRKDDRLKDLFDSLCISDRLYSNSDLTITKFPELHYDKVNERIKHLQSKSLEYLRETLQD